MGDGNDRIFLRSGRRLLILLCPIASPRQKRVRMPSSEFRARAEHRVTFYRSADYVAAHLTAFVESGLLAGETVFIIAPPERRRL